MTQHDTPDHPSSGDSNPSVTCHSCGEGSAAGSRFCEHCGAKLGEGKQARRKRSKGKQLGRRRANKEIASIANILKGVRGLFIVLACIYAAVFLLLIAASSAEEFEGAAGSLLVIPLLMTGSVMLFSILGAAFLYRNPLAWSLALSCLLSIEVAYGFYAGGIPILGCVLILICWSATIKISSIRGLLAEFSDTVAAQNLAGTRKRVEGGELSTRAKVRSARVRASGAPKVAALVVGGILVLALIIVLATKSGKGGGGGQATRNPAEEHARMATEQLRREKSFERVLETFVRSWKSSDLASISTLVPEGDERTLAMSKLRKTLERYGFGQDKLPVIEGRRDLWSRSGPTVKTYFSLPEMKGETRAKLRTHWLEVDAKWELLEVGLRKTKRE
jgi:hypothetical protein